MTVFHSLTSRLAITAVALVAVVSALVGAGAAVAMRTSLTDRLDDDVTAALARALDGAPRASGIDARNQAPGTLIAVLDGPRGDLAVVLGTGRGQRDEVGERSLDRLDRLVPGSGRDDVREVALPDLGRYRVATEKIGDVTVVVGLPTEDVDEAVLSLIWIELLLGLLAVLAAGAAATVLVRRQLAPLREVAETAHNVATLPLGSGEVDVAVRVPERLTDERTEVGRMGAALNTLLSHVETSLEARHLSEQQVRQFVADASHELRTPLATISGYTQLARSRPGDLEASATALAKVQEESGRMTGLVEDLLLLARLDAGRPLASEPVDLTRLLVEAVSDARVLAPEHVWRLDLPDAAVEVTGDEARLHQVVTNLLTNARTHTPAGTTVTLRARPDGFEVHDDGPGFRPDLVASAFERFTRGDEARARTGGAGLGLALVSAIVAAHDGSVSLTSHPGDTTIAVTLR